MGRKLENGGHAEENGFEEWQVTLGPWDVPLVTNGWHSPAGDPGWPHCAWHPSPEVPLGLFEGIRRWLGFLLGLMYLCLLFFSDFSRCFLAPQCT